jgi:eukaryotic-like serine/threonine-protein kinase
MGIVYKAHDRTLNSEVALKIMAPSLADHPRRVERFKREVILARKVAHPNVCRIYDIGQNKGLHYVSMEYIDGRTLAEMLEEGPIPRERGIPLVTEILLALQAAHQAGVIHRDLKPQNIMIDLEGKPHIMDFGISIPLDYSPITTTGALVGTPLYMAPELLQNQRADQRSDLYSAGIVLHEIFTGKKPFDADNRAAALMGQIKSRSARSRALTGELEAIILKALKKNPSERYQSVDQILQDLHQLSHPARRRKRPIVYALIVAVGLVGMVAGLAMWKQRQSHPERANTSVTNSPQPQDVKVPVRITSLGAHPCGICIRRAHAGHSGTTKANSHDPLLDRRGVFYRAQRYERATDR